MDSTGKWIKERLRAGEFWVSAHARWRGEHRFVTEGDIMACGKTAKQVSYQPERGTWKVVGKDLDGAKLTVICAVRDGVLVVTVY